jgi:predicted  nucleic acid-binding Zn-ribbon protein
MFKFLKDILKPGREEGPLTISQAEIPLFLDASGKEGSETLFEKTNVHRKAVESARQELSDLIDEISSKEREEAYHPKIEKVAKNTLPLFRKAMLSSLAKEFPPDPEEFYQAAGECLKGCVKGLAGPGRYLQGVFPEEMKKIREAIDRVGREMNAMTPAISEARKRRELIERARKEISRQTAAAAEYERGGIETGQLRQEIAEADAELSRIREQRAALESGPGATDSAVLAEEMERKKGLLEDEERSVRSDLAVISHVLRKGEKVLQRTQGSAAARGLEEAVDLLAGPGIPDEDQLLPALARTLPLIESMLKSGDIALKNKEEKELLSPDKDVLSHIREDFASLHDARSGFGNADHAYRQSPFLRNVQECEARKVQAEAHRESLRRRISELDERMNALKDEIPDIRHSLEAVLGELAGREVRFIPAGELEELP